MSVQIQKPLLEANSRWQNVIVLVSILIPIVVAVLIYLPPSARLELIDTNFLPHLNGMLNSATAVSLLVSLTAILNNKKELHKNANLAAFGLSAVFLVSYILYHYTTMPTLYGDTDHNQVLSAIEKQAATGRTVYLSLLLSHIVLAIAVVPLVLFSMYFSFTGQFAKHKRLSRFTWPVWFYVAVTGVVVYWLIRPYYPQVITL